MAPDLPRPPKPFRSAELESWARCGYRPLIGSGESFLPALDSDRRITTPEQMAACIDPRPFADGPSSTTLRRSRAGKRTGAKRPLSVVRDGVSDTGGRRPLSDEAVTKPLDRGGEDAAYPRPDRRACGAACPLAYKERCWRCYLALQVPSFRLATYRKRSQGRVVIQKPRSVLSGTSCPYAQCWSDR